MDTFTSLLAGFAIFSILGNLAHNLNMEIGDVIKGGPGLAFVSYPNAIAHFDYVPQVSKENPRVLKIIYNKSLEVCMIFSSHRHPKSVNNLKNKLPGNF